MSFQGIMTAGSVDQLREIVRDLAGTPGSHLVVNSNRTTFSEFETAVRNADVLISDFDGTIDRVGQWGPLRELLTEDQRMDEDQQVAEYFRDECNTLAAERRLILDPVRRRVANEVTREQFEAIVRDGELIDGVREFMLSFRVNRRFVLSAGFYDYIQPRLQKAFGKDEVPVHIFATILKWGGEDNNLLVGCFSETIVVGSNKAEFSDRIIMSNHFDRERVLGIGDSATDVGIFCKTGVPIQIITKEEDPEPGRGAHRLLMLDATFPEVDAFLIGDTYDGLNELRKAS